MRYRFVGCVAALALVAASGRGDDKTKVSDKLKKQLGNEALSVLDGATRVQAFRIKPRKEQGAKEQIAGYPITATGKEQGKDFAAELTSVLKDDKTWFGMGARCFIPGVAFRVWKDKESVDVIICFNCSNFHLIARDAAGKEVHKTGGAFGPNNVPLLKVAKKAFPDDKEIQGIPEKGAPK
jgi:hypothetical protein